MTEEARKRIRTADPFLTMEVLYQLSYPGRRGFDPLDRVGRRGVRLSGDGVPSTASDRIHPRRPGRFGTASDTLIGHVAEPSGTLLHVALKHVTTDVPTASGDQTAGETRARLSARRYAYAGQVVVIDAGRAVGLVSIESLIAADSGLKLADLMEPDPPSITLDVSGDQAAHAMVETRAGCLVVADVDGSFQGVVTTARMMPLLLAEHDEDLARIGGYLTGSSRARRAAREPVGRRLWHRLPWLIVGLLGAMVSALIMGAFETTLESNVLIALFVPAIVYMAGAVGAQTQTVLIRAFAVGVKTRQILFRELVTGALTGVIIGAIFLGFSYLVWGDIEVAIAVSIALLASATVAVAVAIALPALFQKMGLDPAFGSGPLATLIQDLLSITTYFVAVVLIVT